MTFNVDVDWPGNHRRGQLSDERAESSYGIPVLVFDGAAHGPANLPAQTIIMVTWPKAHSGPVWEFIQKALMAGFPIKFSNAW